MEEEATEEAVTATEEGVTATEEATEEAVSTVTLSAVIEAVIISHIMALAGTILLDDALLPTAAMVGLAAMLPGVALGAIAISPTQVQAAALPVADSRRGAGWPTASLLVNIFMASAISVEPASTETLSVTDRVGTAGVAVSGGRVGTTGAQGGEVGPGRYSGHSSSATSSPSHSGRMLTTIRSGPSARISFSPAFSRLGRITGSAIGMVPITTGTGGSRISTPVDILVPATITVAPTMSRSL